MPAHEVRTGVETCPRRLQNHDIPEDAFSKRRTNHDDAYLTLLPSPSSLPTQDKENASSPMATLNASMGEVNRDYHRRVRRGCSSTSRRGYTGVHSFSRESRSRPNADVDGVRFPLPTERVLPRQPC